MKEKHKLKLGPLLKTLFIILVLIAVLTALYISFFTLKRITTGELNREKALLENNVHLWERQIKYDLSFMYDYISTNENVVKLSMAGDNSKTFFALQQISFDLNKYSMLHHGMEEIFFYAGSMENGGFVSSYIRENDGSMMSKERDLTFIGLCEEAGSIGRWTIRELNGVNYLIFILKRNNNYLGCWSSVDYLLQDFVYGTKDPTADHVVFITDDEGISRTNFYLNGIQIDLDAEHVQNRDTGEEYWQIVQSSDTVPICFAEHISQGVIESAVSYVRSTMIVIGIIMVAAIILWSGILEHILYRPIRNLVTHMTLLSAGDLDTRISDSSRLNETRLLYDTFNNMAEEIQDLKIAVYEHELQVQKTNLEYMQIQIHPHFLVNGLNSASAMIDMGRYDAAKDMLAYLAEYYRCQYQQSEGLIPLQNEMRQVDLYLNIQKMRHPGKMDYHCEVDEACQLVPIPPVSILSFAGNSFKYGMNRTTFRTDITIRVKKIPDGTWIEIRDKGPGFTDEILLQLKKKEPIIQKGRECIGMRNAIVRLGLFYDGKASFRAYNDNGAVVEIVIPDQWQEEPV